MTSNQVEDTYIQIGKIFGDGYLIYVWTIFSSLQNDLYRMWQIHDSTVKNHVAGSSTKPLEWRKFIIKINLKNIRFFKSIH